MNQIFEQLKGQLIVSCQAEGDSPFNSPQGVTDFAKAVITGGAAGIRTCGIGKTAAILETVKVPVIGLTKACFPDGTVCITGKFSDVEKLWALETPIIAVDGTFRLRENSLSGPEYITELKQRHPHIVLMADISTVSEALACHKAGADCVSTTLCGYTPDTLEQAKHGPSLEILKECARLLPDFPVFAEGRYNTPVEAAEAINSGAWAVVVGSAITRPYLITEWFAKEIAENRHH